MWLMEETHNDIWNVIQKHDKLNLIAKLEEKVIANAKALQIVHIESKKLRLSGDKCFHMHFSKKTTKCHTSLKYMKQSWKKTSYAVYLGDSVITYGGCEETLRDRELKAIGFILQRTSI